MKIGIPKEIKVREYRVAVTPELVAGLTSRGHTLRIQQGAGESAGFSDAAYIHAGAEIAGTAAEVWASDLVVKVKEPIPVEYEFLRPGLTLISYLHLAANRELTQRLLDSGVTAFAYETVAADGGLPLLRPMSEIAGRVAMLEAFHWLSSARGGTGVLPSEFAGAERCHVGVLGAGVAGSSAIHTAHQLGAELHVLDIDDERLARLLARYPVRMNPCHSTPEAIRELLPRLDVLIGAVLLPGARAPHLVSRTDLATMRPDSVIADIAIDQGGCIETSRPTTHEDPVFTEQGVIHYCVANMPSAYARTATQALAEATAPYLIALAAQPLAETLAATPSLLPGLNTHAGKLTCEPVAQTFDLPCETYKSISP